MDSGGRRAELRLTSHTRWVAQRLGGSAWESNPAPPQTRGATDFEDREGHRAPFASVRDLTALPAAPNDSFPAAGDRSVRTSWPCLPHLANPIRREPLELEDGKADMWTVMPATCGIRAVAGRGSCRQLQVEPFRPTFVPRCARGVCYLEVTMTTRCQPRERGRAHEAISHRPQCCRAALRAPQRRLRAHQDARGSPKRDPLSLRSHFGPSRTS